MRRVSAIANQTLQFYRQSTNPQDVWGRDLFESVVSLYQGRLLNCRIEVQKRMRADLPMTCFEGEIRQVLNNLILNAIDVMHATGGRLLVRSRTSTEWGTGRKGVTLTVADTGAGMSAQVMKNIFEPFFTTKGIGGTGLGLWVSEDIVKRHRGTLRVRSRQRATGGGTVFALFIPFDGPSR